jgi:putative intracellular protease/amidase
MTLITNLSRRAVMLSGSAIGLAAASGFAIAQTTSTTPTPAGATMTKRIVFICSNQVANPNVDFPVGYYLPELAHPFQAFTQKGYQLTIASPNGGAIIHDEMSDPDGRFGNPMDFISRGFKVTPKITEILKATKPIADIKVDDFDAIFVVGGLGPMITFANNEALHRLFASFYEAGKVSATLCHGSVILLKTRLSNGKLLSDGKTWTGFCDAEEAVVDKAYGKAVQPFRIEAEAKKIPGSKYLQGAAPFKPFAVTDGKLVSGQQGSSGMATAEHVIKALET